MANPKGYLLPETIDPEGDRCLLVYIPDDIAYWRAFWGAYEHLGYWFAWERDDAKQGKDAAARWREAVIRTHETWDEFGDFCDMNIQVNVNQECCEQQPLTIVLNNQLHVSQTVINDFLALPGGVVDDGETAPTTDWPTYTDYTDDKCKIATALAEDFYQTLGNLAGFGAGMAGLGSSAQQAILAGGAANSLVSGLMAVGLSLYAAMSVLLSALFAVVGIGAFAFGYFTNIYNQITLDDVICAFYDAGDEATAIANIQALVDGWGTDAAISSLVGGSRFLDILKEIVDLLLAPELLAGLFGLTGMLEDLAPETCPNCTGVVVQEHGTWFLIDGTFEGGDGPFEFATESVSSCDRIRIFFNHDGTGYLSTDTATVTTIEHLSGIDSHCSSIPYIRFKDQAGTVFATHDDRTDPSPVANVAQIELIFANNAEQHYNINWTM